MQKTKIIKKIKVRPNSGKQQITKISEEEYFVSLKSSPENNKANIELIKLMKNYFGKEIRIVTGKTSRKKLIEVVND